MLKNNNYNPDVLSCLANLSSDEVFTPPQLANQILDLLPKELWRDKDAKFLDPVCKSGVFLREIAKRLDKGLEIEIPNRQKRINHIFKNQLFGIAITELTALLSRRSLYCSKTANGKYSVCTSFNDVQGNIFFKRIEHTWKDTRCIYCGASKSEYNRGGELETHAYQFIHNEKSEDIFKMKFDVIIGNPPYHMSDSGFGDSAKPIYHLFIQQAKKLNPSYLSMIIPARWYSGGKGLDAFRDEMLHDNRLKEIHDFPETVDCFPGLNIRGGVCYFLWDKHKNDDKCIVNNYKQSKVTSVLKRPLLEEGTNIFVRYNSGIDILHKVRKFNEQTMDQVVSSRKPFGIGTNFSDFGKHKTKSNNIRLYRFGDDGYINLDLIESNRDLVDKYKVLVAKASPGGDDYPHSVFSKPIIAEPGSACTETYIIVGVTKNNKEAKNLVSYISTRFFRFLVLLIKNTQDVPKKVYSFVPVQNLSEKWTDDKLNKKYKINSVEIDFIESMVRPMELDNE
jgi:site-specific DNA-methyltransferase (adenine-specific)